jgi:hypothetical protein
VNEDKIVDEVMLDFERMHISEANELIQQRIKHVTNKQQAHETNQPSQYYMPGEIMEEEAIGCSLVR